MMQAAAAVAFAAMSVMVGLVFSGAVDVIERVSLWL